jgi:hypothetical protein
MVVVPVLGEFRYVFAEMLVRMLVREGLVVVLRHPRVRLHSEQADQAQP